MKSTVNDLDKPTLNNYVYHILYDINFPELSTVFYHNMWLCDHDNIMWLWLMCDTESCQTLSLALKIKINRK